MNKNKLQKRLTFKKMTVSKLDNFTINSVRGGASKGQMETESGLRCGTPTCEGNTCDIICTNLNNNSLYQGCVVPPTDVPFTG